MENMLCIAQFLLRDDGLDKGWDVKGYLWGERNHTECILSICLGNSSGMGLGSANKIFKMRSTM